MFSDRWYRSEARHIPGLPVHRVRPVLSVHIPSLLDKVPAVAGVVGRPRRRPDMRFADRGYDHDK